MFPHSKSFLPIWSIIALLVSLMGNALTFTPAHAAGILVNTDTDKDGLLMFDGLCGLREAITNANNDATTYPDCAAGSGSDTITFAANYTITLRNKLLVTSAIIIDGNGAANTIVQANASPGFATYRVFEVSTTGNLTLDRLTVRNGQCNEYTCALPAVGGGIYDNGGSLTVSNSSLSANNAGAGGGIYNTSGSLTLTNVTISGNSATYDLGGGMYNYNSSPTLTNVTFSGNTATNSNGGGIYNYFSSPTLTNVTISGNSASAGGGIYNDISSPTLTNVTISGNSALQGGGMFSYNGSPKLTNVTISGNSATNGFGGGMYNSQSGPMLTNVTFSGNTATKGSGGGIFNSSSSPTLINVTISNNSAVSGGGMYSYLGSPSLTNTIVANSARGGDCVGPLTVTSSNNLIEDSANTCGLTNGSSGNIVSVDPKLGPLANNGGSTQTMELLSGSPAIDTGSDGSCPATDQRGISRPQGVHCDIGAFEAPAIPTNTTTFTSIGSQDGWVLESGENTNLGGTLNSTGATLTLGDNATRKQYRSILSFNTASLPDNAVLSSVTLQLKYSSSSPSSINPIPLLGGILVDVRNGFFGTSSGLELVDFQSAPALKTVGPFSPSLSGGYYTIALGSNTFATINKLTTNGGVTQMRLRFKLDDNNDSIANMLNLVSGNNSTTAYLPTLIIAYTTP